MTSFSSGLTELRNWVSLFVLSFNRRHANAAGLYSLLSTKNVLSDKTLFINLGFWENAQSYDEACYRLAEVLAQAAEMNQADTVLDAGFGFAEQDLFWAMKFQPAGIIGLNITQLQVEVANRRVRDAGLGDRIRLIGGSATDMPIADKAVTKVVALESAFHFHTRERFFAEAFRVLKPGGRIATADLLILPGRYVPGSKKWVMNYLGRAAWQVPETNLCSIGDYAEKLRGAGFLEVQVRSIGDQVLLPFRTYVRRWLNTPHLSGKMDGFMKVLWKAATGEMKPGGAFDYIVASARRP